MMNRETQRTFVYLRQNGNGRQSGYARAETRDGRVKLNLVVQGFSGTDAPHAFALTQEGLLLLGPLNLDARGQGGVAAELTQQEFRTVQLLFVAQEEGGGIDIPLAGTVGRGGWVDWTQVRALVAEAMLPKKEAQQEMPSTAEPAQEAEKVPPEPEKKENQPEIVREETEETHEPEPQQPEPDLYDLPAQEDPFEVVERELRTPLAQERRVEMPQLLRNAYWPQLLWPLHDLFERFEEVRPFVQQTDAAFIRVPLGGKWGRLDHYLVGARVRDGWVTGVGYLIPGSAENMPAGLAGYAWEDGYWQSWQYVENE